MKPKYTLESGVKVLDVVWFSATSTIGIVLTENDIGERKAYIKTVSGTSEELDMTMVAEYGNTFPLNSAYELFPQWKQQDENRPTRKF